MLKKKKSVTKKEGQYMNLNMEEIERQLRMLQADSHDCTDFRNDFKQMNKMHGADANYRDKRLGGILGKYNSERNH